MVKAKTLSGKAKPLTAKSALKATPKPKTKPLASTKAVKAVAAAKQSKDKNKYRPLLLQFTKDVGEYRLDRDMLDDLSRHYGWSSTQTIHAALVRLFYQTFPNRMDSGPVPAWLNARAKPTAVMFDEVAAGEVLVSLLDWAKSSKGSTPEDVRSAVFKKAGLDAKGKPIKRVARTDKPTIVKSKPVAKPKRP